MENKVSLHRIIGNVMGNLGLKDVDNNYDDFARWACEAENKIGSTLSYQRFECELTIRNKKATLPKNFVYLNALKYGNKIVPVTKRSFRMFNKGSGTNENVLDNQENRRFVGGNLQTNVPGVPLVLEINYSGAFMAGDVINITIVTNNCGNISNNVFTYIVQAGDSITSIAAEFANQINAIPNIGYTATSNNTSTIITADGPDVILTVSLYTDSVNGTLNQEVIQKRVPTKVNKPEQTFKQEPRTTSSNLANSNVARLNDGLLAQGSGANHSRHFYDYAIGVQDQVFSIDNGCINFNAYDDERIGISYMGIQLDEDGWPMIAEVHEDAVSHYLMYMYKSMEYWAGKLPQHVYRELKTRWFELCSQARGDDELPDTQEMTYLANQWMQLIPPPTKEYF